VTSVDVGMGVVEGNPPQTVAFDLYADSGGIPGVLLESFSVVVNNAFGTLATSTGTTLGTTQLTIGDEYWLIANRSSEPPVVWNFNSIADSGLFVDNGSVQLGTYTLGTFRINAANAVPEPTTLALLSLGLAGLGFSRRKQ
jgi:PEP-CTERM motif